MKLVIVLLMCIVIVTSCAMKIGEKGKTGVLSDSSTNNKQTAPKQHFTAQGDINSYIIQVQDAANALNWALVALGSFLLVGWAAAARNRLQFSQSLRAAIYAVEQKQDADIKCNVYDKAVALGIEKFLHKKVKRWTKGITQPNS